MKKKLLVLAICLATVFSITGCTDLKSEINGGSHRTITVYTADGQEIAHYEGKIDIACKGGYVNFDYNDKRYIYYNCFVESIADID